MTNNQIHTVRSLGHEQPFTAAAAMLHGASAKIELTELERYGHLRHRLGPNLTHFQLYTATTPAPCNVPVIVSYLAHMLNRMLMGA